MPLPVHTGTMATALCWLTANANEPVSYASLVQVLDMEGGPADSHRRVKAVMRRLQAQLRESIVLAPTYASLKLGGEGMLEVDAVQFDHLLEDAAACQANGDDAPAVAALIAALALWRGDPYPDRKSVV